MTSPVVASEPIDLFCTVRTTVDEGVRRQLIGTLCLRQVQSNYTVYVTGLKQLLKQHYYYRNIIMF